MSAQPRREPRKNDELDQALTDLELILGIVVTGTADKPRRLRRIDLALEHMHAWRDERTPGHDSERGGTSSPREVEDRLEQRRVNRQVDSDMQAAPELIRELARTARRLNALVTRNTATVDASKLPSNKTVPGCLSCSRAEGVETKRIGGHWAPVYEKSKRSGLCRFCYDFARAHDGDWPPVKACDLYHRQGPSSAGRWLAKRMAALTDSPALTKGAR